MSAWINAFNADPLPAIIVLAALVVVGMSGVWYADHWREKAEKLQGRLEKREVQLAVLRDEIRRRDVNLRLLPPHDFGSVVTIDDLREEAGEPSAAAVLIRQIEADIARNKSGGRNGTR